MSELIATLNQTRPTHLLTFSKSDSSRPAEMTPLTSVPLSASSSSTSDDDWVPLGQPEEFLYVCELCERFYTFHDLQVHIQSHKMDEVRKRQQQQQEENTRGQDTNVSTIDLCDLSDPQYSKEKEEELPVQEIIDLEPDGPEIEKGAELCPSAKDCGSAGGSVEDCEACRVWADTREKMKKNNISITVFKDQRKNVQNIPETPMVQQLPPNLEISKLPADNFSLLNLNKRPYRRLKRSDAVDLPDCCLLEAQSGPQLQPLALPKSKSAPKTTRKRQSAGRSILKKTPDIAIKESHAKYNKALDLSLSKISKRRRRTEQSILNGDINNNGGGGVKRHRRAYVANPPILLTRRKSSDQRVNNNSSADASDYSHLREIVWSNKRLFFCDLCYYERPISSAIESFNSMKELESHKQGFHYNTKINLPPNKY